MESAEASFDFTFGLGAGCDQMGDAECREGTLELGARVTAIGGGLVAEEGQAIGVDGQRSAMNGEGVAKVLEVVPGCIGGDEDTSHQFAGVIIHGQEKSLLFRGGPPLVDGGIVLPEFTHLVPLPSSPGLGARRWRADQQGEVSAGVGRDRLAVALEDKASLQFIGHELEIGRSLERQEDLEEFLHVVRPGGVMVAPGEVEAESGRMLKPRGAQAEEMGAAEIQQLRGGGGVKLAPIEGLEGLQKERQGDAFEELLFCKGQLDARGARRARLFVSSRDGRLHDRPSLRTGLADHASGSLDVIS